MAFRNETTFTDALIPWCKSGDAATTTDATALPLIIHKAARVVGCRLRAATAPTGADLIADLHNNGATMFTTQANRPRIVAAAVDSGAWAVPDLVALAPGDVLTTNVDQIGAVNPGTQLTFHLRLLQRV